MIVKPLPIEEEKTIVLDPFPPRFISNVNTCSPCCYPSDFPPPTCAACSESLALSDSVDERDNEKSVRVGHTCNMASQSAGIQQLLIAEKRAAEKIDAARKRKQRRLKQAKDEAQSEVEAYRGERETAYKERETAHMGSRGDLEARIDGQTDVKLNEVDAAFQRNKDDVLKNLMDLVMDVEPQLHKNQKHFL